MAPPELTIKLTAMGTILLLSFFGVALPFAAQRCCAAPRPRLQGTAAAAAEGLLAHDAPPPPRASPLKAVLAGCNCFAGGVLLATALCHMLPDALGELRDAPDAQSLPVFPWAELALGCGYLLVMGIEGAARAVAAGVAKAAYAAAYTATGVKEHGRMGSTAGQGMRGVEAQHSHGGGEVAAMRHGGFKCVVVLTALTAHSLLEGMAIGSTRQLHTTITLTLAIGFHKAFAAFALGTSIQSAELSGAASALLASIFCFASPLGIGLGYWVEQSFSGLVAAFVTAACAGTLLNVSNSFLAESLGDFNARAACSIGLPAVIVGFGAMSALALVA